MVITLIMLSVITFMAVTFLVLSHRERGSVTTTTDQTTARFAAGTAQERALAEILARLVAFTNDQNFDLIVSTNFINPAGFDPNAVDFRTNVNYDYLVGGGGPLNWNNLHPTYPLQNIADLFYNPRPPVFVTTNRYLVAPPDFRFYLDLNRNGRYDTNGFLPVRSPDPNNPYYNATNGARMPTPVAGITSSNFFVGDPEWIGVLEHPDRPHSADNKFVSRYAYLVVPAGKTLDVNYVHNDSALGRTVPAYPETFPFRRNMGVGTWEMNLAAFLADLNTNQWDANPASIAYYEYLPLQGGGLPPMGIANGHAFEDADALLKYRYNFGNPPWANLQTYPQYFGPVGALPIQNDYLDEFGSGYYLTGTQLPTVDYDRSPQRTGLGQGWPGSDNPNHFYAPGDFFDSNKIQKTGPIGFIDRMLAAGNGISSYDRYTFYRMLAQLGTDSAPEQGKININYDNVDANGNAFPGMETNFIPWTPNAFFNAAADRLLRTNTTTWINADLNSFTNTFGVANIFGLTTNASGVMGIPVFSTHLVTISTPSNTVTLATNVLGYTQGIHRMLQLVANIYDATTNHFSIVNGTNILQAPTVFRPIFRRDSGNSNVFIVAYRELAGPVNPAWITQLTTQSGTPPQGQMVELADSVSRLNIPVLGTPVRTLVREPMVYGIPLVIGAKKGFPNFNKFALQNAVTVVRKLNFHRLAGQPIYGTNQVFSLGITNSFGAQAWNSYQSSYARSLRMIIAGDVSLSLTNEFGPIYRPDGSAVTNDIPFNVDTQPTNISNWPGFVSAQSIGSPSFMVPLLTNYLFVPAWVYLHDQNRFTTNGTDSDALNKFPVPNWLLNLKTRLRYMLVDVGSGRIVDYVNLESTQGPMNIMALMQDGAPCVGNLSTFNDPDQGSFWCTNRLGYPNLLQQPAVDNPYAPTFGIMNQIYVCEGMPQRVSQSFWNSYNHEVGFNDVKDSVTEFRARLFGNPTTWTAAEGGLDFGAPFSPQRTFYQYVDWQPNDPLVHYTIPDLTDLLGNRSNIQRDGNTGQPGNPVAALTGQNALAHHYRPWGGNPVNTPLAGAGDPTKFLMSVKDPAITNSDAWRFPTNRFPNVGWLGRVHRGTPWQTVYLKSTRVDPATWLQWAGATNLADALFMSWPTNDWLLFDVFTAAINDNATHGQLSVNQTNLAAWSAVLSGVIVLSNTPSGAITNLVVQPAGIYDPSKPPALVQIVNGINNTRSNSASFPSGVFTHEGQILATPQLTEQSPFLNVSVLSNPLLAPSAGGLTDEVVERIPQQIMGLLTLSHTPRFVIYSYGQTLKPAEQSIQTASGPFFGLCTNYQVTAETATRAVVRVEGAPQTPRVVLEQFNVLPAD